MPPRLYQFDPRITVEREIFPPRPYYESPLVHGEMLGDKIRMAAFYKAIKATVKGKVVLEIGTGTGVLAMLAAKEGAKKVYALEASRIIKLAKRLAEDNRLEDKIQFIKGYSTSVSLPERAEILISDLIGHYGIEEDIIEVFSDARKRLLKPGALIIPNSLDLYLVPVACPEFEKAVNFYSNIDKEVSGLRLPYFEYKLSCLKKTSFLIEGRNLHKLLLSSPKKIRSFDLYQAETSDFTADLEYRITKEGKMHGCLGWFKVCFFKDIALQTSPWDPLTHWLQCFFPTEPKKVKKGEKVKLSFQYQKPPVDERDYRFQVKITD